MQTGDNFDRAIPNCFCSRLTKIQDFVTPCIAGKAFAFWAEATWEFYQTGQFEIDLLEGVHIHGTAQANWKVPMEVTRDFRRVAH